MKLISLYIENFGKISKQDFDFNSTLTAFCQENGYGKTTLATFIKVMFYGMPIVKTNSKFNDREHYYPFGGGKFGGNITFISDGKTYKIVRFFDKKSDTKDEVTLYENDSKIEVPENLGKFFFGVDESSFLRTLYFDEPSSVSSNSKNSDVTFKLTGIVENTDDESFEKAKKVLEEEGKKLKKTGSKGEIFDNKREIILVKEDISNLKEIDEAITKKYEERNLIKSQIDALEMERKKVYELKIKENNFLTYEKYLDDAKAVKVTLDEINKNYPLGLPNTNEIEILNSEVDNLTKYNAQKPMAIVDDRTSIEFESLTKTFSSGVPTQEEIERVKSDINSTFNSKGNKKAFNPTLFIIGVTEIIISIILLIFNNIWGLTFTGLGILFTALSFLLNRKNKARESEKLNKIANYLSAYKVFTPNLLDGVYTLKNKVDRFNFLEGEISNKHKFAKEIESKINTSLSVITQIFNKYQIVVSSDIKSQINGIKTTALLVKNKEENYNSILKNAREFKEKNNLDIKPNLENNNYDDLSKKIEEIDNKLKVIDREIKNGEDLLETLADKENYLSELIIKQEKLEKKYSVITKTLEFLTTSEESLKSKYITPVKDKFLVYAQKLEKVLGEKVIMDKNFEVYFERGGENKSREYLSAGQKVLCDMCLRLALIDNMYKDSRPFIILDDPFIVLDEENLFKAIELLKELAIDRQIIYFTCHPSRFKTL